MRKTLLLLTSLVGCSTEVFTPPPPPPPLPVEWVEVAEQTKDFVALYMPSSSFDEVCWENTTVYVLEDRTDPLFEACAQLNPQADVRACAFWGVNGNRVIVPANELDKLFGRRYTLGAWIHEWFHVLLYCETGDGGTGHHDPRWNKIFNHYTDTFLQQQQNASN